MTTILPQSFGSTHTNGPPDSPLAMRAKDRSRELIWLFWGGAIESCIELVDDATLFIGPHSDAPAVGVSEVEEAFRKLRRLVSPLHVLNEERYDATPMGWEGCSITAICKLEQMQPLEERGQHSQAGATGNRSYTIMCSFVWALDGAEGDALRLVSLHCSVAHPMSALLNPRRNRPHHGRALVPQDRGDQERVPADALQTTDASGTSHWFSRKDVVYVRAAHQYTDICCVNRHLRIRGSFGAVLEQLGDAVVRVHRSYAVNPDYLSHMKDSVLYLSTGDHVPVPTNRRRDVRRLFLQRSTKLGSRE